MIGIVDKTGREVRVGDRIRFGGKKLRVVELHEGGHDGFYGQTLEVHNGEMQIVRYALVAMAPKLVEVID